MITAIKKEGNRAGGELRIGVSTASSGENNTAHTRRKIWALNR